MLQQLFTDTIESRFIKQLLYQTPMPILDTCTDDTYLVKGCYYVYKYFIIRCDKSGRISSKDAEITKICPFTFGVFEPGISFRYLTKNRYYDSEDHKQLGKYLRCVRDLYSIDLMPFYNCFNNQLINDIVLTTNGYEVESNSEYKVLATPIKYNTTYTIAVDCAEEILIRPIVYSRVGIDKTSQTELDKVVKTTYGRNMNSFKKPFTYSLTLVDDGKASTQEVIKYLKDRERDLYLLVQLPKNNTSSFVVLEGDYTSVDAYKVFSSYVIKENETVFNNISDQALNTYLLSSLSLLRINDRNIYAFSDALVEYLLINVITSQENISQNILRVQNSLYPSILEESKRTSVWTDDLRKTVYRTYMDSIREEPKYVKKYFGEAIDINGFVGKRVEDMLSSLKYKDKVDGN